MYKHFITNREKIISDVINNVIPYCSKLHFLVGYFYFTGFREVYKWIALEQNMRILVGLDAETRIGELLEYSSYNKFEKSREVIKDEFFTKNVNILSEREEFDNRESLEAFNLFISKLENGTLEVKKTLEPCHAKMYLMEMSAEHNQNGEYLGTTILGSSNFSLNGFKNNFEVNIKEMGNDFFIEGKQVFDELWENAIPLANKNTLIEVKTRLADKVWFNKLYSPFLIYIKVLTEYFSVRKFEGLKLPRQILGNDFIDLKYQIDSIQKALEVIIDHNGVIIADVVGLGKSIIASAVAENLNLPTIIITPPHLKTQWEEYASKLSLSNKIFTNGKIDAAVEYINKTPEKQKLIIIDEAHRYRNQNTQMYSDLETLCRGNKVILLTATPFNNKPQDIFSLIRLFQIPQKATIKTIENLSREFGKINEKFKKMMRTEKNNKNYDFKINKEIEKEKIEISNSIKILIGSVVIRRNRKDIENSKEYRKDLEKQGIKFPIIEEPKISHYDLGEIAGNYLSSLNKITDKENGFNGTRYKPTTYLKEAVKDKILQELGLFSETQANLSKFMRRLLVRRFESSVFSFQETLKSVLTSYEKILDFYNRNDRVIISKKSDLSIFDNVDLSDYDIDTSDSDIMMKEGLFDEQESLFKLSSSNLTKEKEKEFAEKGIYFIHKKYIKDEFIEDLQKDIKILTELKEYWSNITPDKDPKLQGLKVVLKNQLEKDPERKIILFSEFADTIDYLVNNLSNDACLKVINYKSGMGSGLKDEVRADFDASYTGKKTDKYNVLLATDALSEGVNLNRAGTIFNYDIPYNPTKVIQRVGRINRINKKMFDKLFIYNYFPTEIGENEINIKKISTSKMNMIGLILGEDTKYLTDKEIIRSSQFRINTLEDETESWETKYKNFLETIKTDYKDLYDMAQKIPPRSRLLRTKCNDNNGALIFGRKGNACVFVYYNNISKQIEFIPDEKAIQMFSSDKEEKALNVSDAFYDIYEQSKQYLFSTREGNKYGKNQQEAFRAINILKSFSPKMNYLDDLEKVIRLDAFCNFKLDHIKMATKDLKNGDTALFKNNISILQQQIPYSYIKRVLAQEESIETQKDLIILSEEFNSSEVQGDLL